MCYTCDIGCIHRGGYNHDSFNRHIDILINSVKNHITPNQYFDKRGEYYEKNKEFPKPQNVTFELVKEIFENSDNKLWFEKLTNNEIGQFVERLIYIMIYFLGSPAPVFLGTKEQLMNKHEEYCLCTNYIFQAMIQWIPESYFPINFPTKFNETYYIVCFSRKTINNSDLSYSSPVVQNRQELKEMVVYSYLIDLMCNGRQDVNIVNIVLKNYRLYILQPFKSVYSILFLELYCKYYPGAVNTETFLNNYVLSQMLENYPNELTTFPEIIACKQKYIELKEKTMIKNNVENNDEQNNIQIINDKKRKLN
jgi:hypothetical protein